MVIKSLPTNYLPTQPVWVVSASFPTWAFHFNDLYIHLQGVILVEAAVQWAPVLQQYFQDVTVCSLPTSPPEYFYNESILVGDAPNISEFYFSLPWLNNWRHITYLGYGSTKSRSQWRGSRKILVHADCGGCTTASIVLRFYTPILEWNRTFKAMNPPQYPWTSVQLHLSSTSSVSHRVKSTSTLNRPDVSVMTVAKAQHIGWGLYHPEALYPWDIALIPRFMVRCVYVQPLGYVKRIPTVEEGLSIRDIPRSFTQLLSKAQRLSLLRHITYPWKLFSVGIEMLNTCIVGNTCSGGGCG